MARPTIPPEVMTDVCRIVMDAPDWVPIDKELIARRLGVTRRTVHGWLQHGAKLQSGYALVGLAYRLRGAGLASRALGALAQAPLEGAAMWGRT